MRLWNPEYEEKMSGDLLICGKSSDILEEAIRSINRALCVLFTWKYETGYHWRISIKYTRKDELMTFNEGDTSILITKFILWCDIGIGIGDSNFQCF